MRKHIIGGVCYGIVSLMKDIMMQASLYSTLVQSSKHDVKAYVLTKKTILCTVMHRVLEKTKAISDLPAVDQLIEHSRFDRPLESTTTRAIVQTMKFYYKEQSSIVFEADD